MRFVELLLIKNKNMESNIQKQMIDIFKYNLRKDARTVSVATLLSQRYLKRIKYDPYYQRNYVWEKDKQSFFIESIFLGTEIPPIVLYKSGTRVEVIDGRQRFETIKRFKENDFSLHASGLMSLNALAGKKYSDLKPEFQQLFDDTKIRIFEFEILGKADLTPILEDKVKKEIFRRYNTGITPLNQSEVDNAKYDDDSLTEHLKNKLKSDADIYGLIKKCFFISSNKEQSDLIVDMVTELRKLLVLRFLPISRYADSGKSLLLEMFYDRYVGELCENEEPIIPIAEKLLNDILNIREILPDGNSYIYECLIWAISVLEMENYQVDLDKNAKCIIDHYKDNFAKYDTGSDHYYGNIMRRFEDTAKLMNNITGFDFKQYLRNQNFRKKTKAMVQTETEVELTMDKLAGLRISKPNPGSKPIDQLLSEIETEKYLIRPSYQRQEKINIYKASSIIESILLGIKLPPLFLYVREDGVREVIDGQQRLLTILGFLGRKYKNEEGVLTTSRNHNFQLKGLRILVDYNGKKFADILTQIEDTILDFDIDEIEIRQDINPDFEPTDLFIRLNNKPYPIRLNTFEMWNSTTERSVVEKIKQVTQKNIDWFYITSPKTDESGNPRDRMQNEELITILSYLCYNNYKTHDIDRILGFYPRMKMFTCRLKTKSSLTNILESLEYKPLEKELFLKSIERTEEIIELIKDVVLNGKPSKESLNEVLNIKGLVRFSRSYQEFYIMWMLLMDVNSSNLMIKRQDLLDDMNELFKKLKNVEEEEVDNTYVNNFLNLMSQVRKKYQ